MNSQLGRQVLSITESEVCADVSAYDFEILYQSKVAVEQIGFAIKATEQTRTIASCLEAALEPLDVLDLPASFGCHFRCPFRLDRPEPNSEVEQEMQKLQSVGVAQDSRHE